MSNNFKKIPNPNNIAYVLKTTVVPAYMLNFIESVRRVTNKKKQLQVNVLSIRRLSINFVYYSLWKLREKKRGLL